MFFSLAALDIISVAIAMAVCVLLFLMNPCWFGFNWLCIRRCDSSLLFRIFSRIFLGTWSREMGL